VIERDRHLLARAYREALRAEWLFTAPNPRVGALALAGGQVIGYGHHARLGGPHAEETALRDAGAWDEERGAPLAGVVDEMIVTLEPCSTRGSGKRRPACAELLRAAGVRRILIGCEDPDPQQHGASLAAARAAGVEVSLLPIAQETALAAFRAALAQPERPFVLLKWAASLDGKIAAASGASRWISGEESRAEVHALRSLSDAVLCGRGTLLADDPELTARPYGTATAVQPLRVLLDAPVDLPAAARVLAATGPRLWVHDPSSRAPRSAPAADLTLAVPRLAAGHLDLASLLHALRRDHGVRRLLVEGGAAVHGSFLGQRLADGVVRYEAPLLLGGSRAACAGVGVLEPSPTPRLIHEERRDLGPDLRRAFLIAS
jgi:diaminohydroxyphosphoribosylaminopyrimidine deaminase/5-amino-6-(5-phosphoribosylamino)uracil reductase